MIITYFIGNGFDKALELQTGYRDFYESIKDIDFLENIEFITMSQNTQEIIKDIYLEIEKENKENWSDFELGLINYLNRQNKDYDVDNFIEAISFFSYLLNDYLNLEYVKFKEKRQLLDTDKLRDQILCPFEECEALIKQGYYNILRNNTDLLINFLTFNYTFTLEDIFGGDIIFPYAKYIGNQRVKFLSPIHLHGTLKNNMLIGIDNISQISNEEIRNKFMGKEHYIEKPSMNKFLSNAVLQHSDNCLNNSQIVVIFGSSIGVTDNIWWEKIGKWYSKDKNRKIILFHYLNKKISRSNFVKSTSIKEKIGNDLLKKMKIDSSFISESERISIIINTEYFLKNIINDVKEEVKK